MQSRKEQKTKEERITTSLFLRFLSNVSYNPERLKEIDEDEDSAKSPEFYYNDPNLLIEVKGLQDEKDNTISAKWKEITSYLKEKIEKKLEGGVIVVISSEQSIDGLRGYRKKKSKYEERFLEEIEKITEGQTGEIEIESHDFKIKKYKEPGESKVVFVGASGGSFRAEDVIEESLNKIVPEANSQLAYKKEEFIEHKKILLIENKYFLSDFIVSYHSVIGKIFNIFEEKTENIDEIWLQRHSENGETKHDLVFSKKFLKELEKEDIQSSEAWKIFKNLLPYLKDSKKQRTRILNIIEKLKENDSNIFEELKENDFEVSSILQISDYLWEEKKYEKISEIVRLYLDFLTEEYFKESSIGEVYKKYDEEIKKGEHINNIYGSPAFAAVALQKLALSKEAIKDSLEKTIELREFSENLFFQNQVVIFPLLEIVKRRRWLIDQEEMSDEKGMELLAQTGESKGEKFSDYRKLKEVCFNYLELCSKNKGAVNLKENIVTIFNFFKELNTEEAEKVLNSIGNVPESGSLYLYYGIFRKNHYEGIEFNSKIFEEKLKEAIEKNSGIARKVAWSVVDIIKNKPSEIENLLETIDHLLDRKYEPRIHGRILSVIDSFEKQKKIEIIKKASQKWIEIEDSIFEDLNNDVFFNPTTEMLDLLCKEERKLFEKLKEKNEARKKIRKADFGMYNMET